MGHRSQPSPPHAPPGSPLPRNTACSVWLSVLCAQVKLPDRRNMFSDVGHYPSYQLRLKDNKDIPGFVPQEFHGYDNGAAGTDMVGEISGPNRPKYFHRPVVPFLHAVPPEMCAPVPAPRCACACVCACV